jgi:hypothetical protein
VTLWEIFSLCITPYAGLSNREVVSYIRRGERLDKPGHCPHDMYETMQRCWFADYSARPAFLEITAIIEKYLCKEGSYLQLQEVES